MTRFQDLDLNLTKHPVSGDVSMLTDANAVKRSIRNLLSMNAFEKPFNPAIRSGILDLLFENDTPVTRSSLQKLVRQVIENYEPRVNVQNIVINTSPNENSYKLDIYFRIRNSTETQVVEAILKRLR